MINRLRQISFLFLSLLPLCAYSDLTLPHLFSDGAVLQRSQAIAIWGWAKPSTQVEMQFSEHKRITKSDAAGFWHLELPAMEAGGPYSLYISSDSDKKTIEDILIGDVWLCSGQSNMEWLLKDADNAGEALANANDTKIRHFKVPRSWSASPESKLAGGEWQVSSTEVAGDFTAVGYFFAKELRKHVDVPIGLLHSSWGGSNIESWMPATLQGLTNQQAQLNLEAAKAKERSIELQVLTRLKRWPETLVSELEQAFEGATAQWQHKADATLDWANITVPGLWESDGYQGMDGVVWYRKQFELNDRFSRQNGTLNLARIDDTDEVWLNGHLVGRTDGYNVPRSYSIESSWLKAGTNTLMVRVVDAGGGGGIYSSAALSLDLAEQKIPLSGEWEFRPEKVQVNMAGDKNQTPTALYNKMMNPLFSYPIKGVLWYQGESNAGSVQQAKQYNGLFTRFIKHLRSAWGQLDLPFYWVQLANYQSGGDNQKGSPWAELRESQSKALALPHTGQAVTIDVGNAKDIHPRDKQTVGERLASIALNKDYGFEKLPFQGPEFVGAKVKGQSLVVTMRSSSKLTVSDGEKLKGFELAGADGTFYPADAKLHSKTIVVHSDRVKQPIAVRYAWSENPEDANLSNADGFPASPFRSN